MLLGFLSARRFWVLCREVSRAHPREQRGIFLSSRFEVKQLLEADAGLELQQPVPINALKYYAQSARANMSRYQPVKRMIDKSWQLTVTVIRFILLPDPAVNQVQGVVLRR